MILEQQRLIKEEEERLRKEEEEKERKIEEALKAKEEAVRKRRRTKAEIVLCSRALLCTCCNVKDEGHAKHLTAGAN